MERNPMIEVKGLVKRIGEKTILRGVQLHVEKGQTVGILGSNGAGKSTLLKVIATIMKPTNGIITIDGKDIKKDAIKVKQMLGYLPHTSMVYDHFSPYENLKFFGSLYQVPNLEERVHELIDKVGLKLFTNEPVQSFSRGMAQRIAIARAIIHRPQLLLLDEPHTGLDQNAIGILNQVVEEMKGDQVTTLMVTHDFLQAAKICDRFIIIKGGKVADDFLLANGDVQTLYERYQNVVEGRMTNAN